MFRPHVLVAAFVLLFATFAHAADSQFLFDANGNLLVQSENINAPPQITGQPQNQIVAAGETTAFSVVATGTLPLTFQWRFNNANIGGATGDALLLQNVSTSHEGEFRVVVTNPSGSVTSAPALLILDSDHDGMGDSWEFGFFSNLNQNALGDFDGDGSSNLEEFRNGTDPTDGNSYAFRLVVIRDAGSVIKTPDRTAYTNGQTVTLTAIPPTNGFFHAWLGDIVTRSNAVTLVMTNDKTVYARFTPIAFTWTNLANGDWDTARNWTPNLVPGSNDTAAITNSVTVTLDTRADCADFVFGSAASNPTLTGNGTLTVRGFLSWDSGTMSGSGRTIIEPVGQMVIANPLAVFLTSRTLENAGTALWTGDGSIALNSSAVITNRAGALFEVKNGAAFSTVSGGNRIDNAGTFRKSAGAGTTTFVSGVSFNNYGAVEIQTGSLNFGGGGTHSAGSSMTGAGHLIFSAGTANLAGLVNVSGSNTFIGGTANFTGNYICTNNTIAFLNVPGCTANLSGTGLVSPAVLNMGGGTLTGTSTVTVLGAMNWTDGTMSGSGRTIIATGRTMTVASPSFVTLTTRTLENAGTALWTGVGFIAVNGGGVITNRAGALFHVQNAAGLGGGGANGRFDNAGTFRKSANTGTTTVASGVSFNNSGTVQIQTGTLILGGGGTHSGSFDVPAATALILSGGTHVAGGGSSITGAGQFTIGGGTANLAGLVNVSGSNTFSGGTANLTGNYICTNNTVTISGVQGGTANFSGTGLVSPTVLNLNNNATLTGTSTVTVNSVMNWTGGAMSGGGRTIISAGAILNAAIPSTAILDTRTLENGGTILWTGAGNFGLFGSAVITNRAGALFHAQTTGNLGFFSGACRFDNAGTFRKSANNGTLTIGSSGSFNNSGTVDIRSGILAANGAYNSSSTALLNCALGGTTPGTGFGQLKVAGTVTLNGALSVDLINGFVPATNDSFTVLTAGTRTGTFANFFYPSNTVTMQLSNTANSVIVRVTDVPISIPQPMLLVPEILGADLKLTWTSVSNVTYRLEYNPDLNFLDASNWTALPGDIPGISNTASKLDALTPSNRFYRVRLVP